MSKTRLNEHLIAMHRFSSREFKVPAYTRYFIAIISGLLLSVGWSLWAADQGGTPKPPPTPKPATQPTTTTLEDGTPVTTQADGSKTSQYEPGSSYTQHPNGSKSVEETTRTPDGQSVKTKTTYKPEDGTRIKEFPDDPTKTPLEEKPVATRTGKKGQKEYTYADGEVVTFTGKALYDFQVEKHNGRETTKYRYNTHGARSIDVSGYRPSKPISFGTGAKIVTLIDNRPDYNVCVAGNFNMTELQSSFYGQFKASDFSLKSLGGMSGYGHVFSTNAPVSEYNTWLQNSGNRSCEGFDAELNFCTLMAPLTAFRGHDHEHHHGALHSHDAPDPPLSWGRNPPRIVVRLDRGPRGK